MCIKKYSITLILLLFGTVVAYSQEDCTEKESSFRTDEDFVDTDTKKNSVCINKRCQNIEVHFKFDKYNLDLNYMDNKASLHKLAHKIDSIGVSKIDSIVIVSQSSPEGVYEYNLMLSRNRATTMHKYILNNHPELSERLFVYPDGESWSQLREYVKKDTLMKNSSIEKVISIIDADINIVTKKWRMKQLPVYRYLLRTYYPRIRNSIFCIVYYSEIKLKKIEPVCKMKLKVETVVPDSVIVFKPKNPEVKSWNRKLYLKTNAIGLGMGIANVAAEIDLAKHWSFLLPIYYSAWNYFKSTIKFRTLAVQPEFRYWLKEENEGFFTGAHVGLAYYNFAFDGDYRYQDHNRKTPALGGGVNVGYRLPISKNHRWQVEFSLGAAVYSRHYDKFYNTPNTKDGLMVESIKKTYWGIDQAAVSFSYSFDLKKKGGKR